MTQDTTDATTDATTVQSPPHASRRSVLLGVGAAAAGVTVLAGCGTSSAGSSTAGGAAGGAAGGGGSAVSVPVSDVPVGGGTILQNPAIVVTQPSQGTFEAFSAICPHAGCPVAAIQGGLIICPCHGSEFDIATGDVKAGPAPPGLAKLTATLSGSSVEVS